MKLIHVLLVLAAIATYGAANVPPSEIKFIASPNVSTSEISRDELSRIFLMTKTSLPGAPHVEPVLARTGAAHGLFLKAYMGRTNEALMTYYRSLLFTGKASIPKSFGSDAEVAEYVRKTKGAIGYVSTATVTTGLKTLQVR